MILADLPLRAKLVAVITVIGVLASCPLLYWNYQDAYERAMESTENDFETTARLIDEALQLSYLDAQTLVTEKAELEKEYVRGVLKGVESYLAKDDSEGLAQKLLWMMKDGTQAAVLRAPDLWVNGECDLRKIYDKGVTDFLGFSLKDYAHFSENRIGREYFAFLRTTFNGKRRASLLVGMRRTPAGFLLAAEEVGFLSTALSDRLRVVESHLKDVVRSLALPEGATVAVTSGSGLFIAGRGANPYSSRYAVTADVYEAARAKGTASGELKEAGLLYAVRYFKPLDWYIEMTLPESVAAVPARNYAVKLSVMVLAVFVLLAGLGIATVTRVLRPLRRIAASARGIAAIDFMEAPLESRLAAVSEGLPASHADEVGQVADAFRHMTSALDVNIARLKTTLAHQHSLLGELNAASEIQRGMLTAEGETKGTGFEAFAAMQPAKAVGGDLYDVLDAPDGRKVFVLGDVSGKGVSAALLMSVTLTMVRQAVSLGLSPTAVMKKVNDQLAANNPSCMFVTLWIGCLDAATGTFVFANGGHCPPAIVSEAADAPVRWLREVSGPLVGVFAEAEFKEFSDRLEAGDLMLIYSDGVTEAMDGSRQLFGEKRLEQAAKGCRGFAVGEAVQRIAAAVEEHRAGAEPSDDMTMLAVKRLVEAA